MITIQRLDKNRITLRCHYAYRRRCHEIPGADFDHARKVWVCPISSLPYIQTAFAGEIYYKTPLWKLRGGEAPKKEPLHLLGPMPEIPELALKPYGYQADGIRFMIDRLNNEGFCLNGDGVGLGKTFQTIGTMKWFVENRGARKILVVCKKSLKTQWSEEIRKIAGWTEEEFPVFISGGTTKKKKQEPFEGIRNAPKGILITNYQDFLNDWKGEIDKVGFDLYVIDEAHCIKGRTGVMNKSITDTICGRPTILLTGTPILSRPDDIWGIVRLAKPGFFGEYEEFKEAYINTEFGIYGEQIIGAHNLDDLQRKMSKFLIMRSAEDAAIDLPQQRPARNIGCDMDPLQQRMQQIVEERKGKLDQRKQELLDEKGATPEVREEIEQINDLSKMYIATMQFIADDPAVFRFRNPEKGINRQLLKMVPQSYRMSAKTEATVDAVAELVDADEKVIVFCHFATAARMLKSHFDKIPGANTVMYTGAEGDAEREANIASFREDPECRVIIGTEAMAEGLNLQVSRHVIHYEQADTYAQRNQREGRIRRIGSAYDYINVIDIVTQGSFDETKLNKLRHDYVVTGAVLGSKAS